ncbi:hypothetical protein MLD38_030079 [Melastoma candidum]|uniref:Uncharacterized protein n=1 Tax=Melastoma candidum TaxID=119954 RepID=A0ACB9MKR4_9MYRT|nr:hypothetical protein MLD38_030079 [Melastoma candidum]
MELRDIGAALPPGFRFYPSDEELVCHYLYNKICNEEGLKGTGTGTTLVDVDLHTCEPWQLPDAAKLNASEWFFFSFRDRKYATGLRTNRATTTGYWKATGKDKTVHDPVTREIIGMRKTLVFYRNRAPNGIKTGWIMHEFRLETPRRLTKEDWVLCRVFERTKSQEHNNGMFLDEKLALRPRQSHMFNSDNLSNLVISRPNIMTPPPFLDLKIDNNNPAVPSPLQLHDNPPEADSSDFMFLWDSVLAEEGGLDYGVLSGLSCLDTLDTMDF